MSTDAPEAIPAPVAGKSWMIPVVGALALAAVVVGAMLALRAGQGQVEMIRVTKHSMLPESFVGSPDYYVNVALLDDKVITTEAFDDSPIGNGLDFELATPLEMEDIARIELMDKDLGRDDIRDRVDVRERIGRGQDYQFELIGPASPHRNIGYTVLGIGGAVLVVAAILWVRAHAI